MHTGGDGDGESGAEEGVEVKHTLFVGVCSKGKTGCAGLQGMRDDMAQGVRERVEWHLSEVSDGREG